MYWMFIPSLPQCLPDDWQAYDHGDREESDNRSVCYDQGNIAAAGDLLRVLHK